MANWVVKAARHCQPLIDLLQKEIRSGPLINVDETPYQVLNEPGRCNTSKSYMWVFKGGIEDRPALLYQIEKQAKIKKLEPIQIYQLRQEKAKPVLEDWSHIVICGTSLNNFLWPRPSRTIKICCRSLWIKKISPPPCHSADH